jgi:putative endonuclease
MAPQVGRHEWRKRTGMIMRSQPCAAYIMANKNKTLYVGSTVDLIGRVIQHKNEVYPNSFSAEYHCHTLVHYEFFATLREARDREYQIKRWRREKKVILIELDNPDWRDLSDDLENG